tara:strand:- start:333 stop:791 length:459 start_codon:yes stop_codon:yes gene_type:complete
MAGFTFRYCLYGGRPLVLDFLMKDTETLTKGDLLNVESGEVDLAVTSDAALAGAFMGPKDPADATDGSPGVVAGTDSTTLVECIASPDAVYGVADANARLPGALLDIAGATGAQTLAASSNTEFVVVERKRQNADETRVMILPDSHYLIKGQ